jgi:hypothetical protein
VVAKAIRTRPEHKRVALVPAISVGRLVADMGDLVASTTGPQIRVAGAVAPDLRPTKSAVDKGSDDKPEVVGGKGTVPAGR